MIPYKFIDDLTSDVMFEAYGKDLKQVFRNSALAMFEVICDVDAIEPKEKSKLQLKGENSQDLLYKFLSELIALVDTEQMFYSKFKILDISESHLIAECYGEPITPQKGHTLVKAVLYYGFKLEKTPKGYVARIACDI